MRPLVRKIQVPSVNLNKLKNEGNKSETIILEGNEFSIEEIKEVILKTQQDCIFSFRYFFEALLCHLLFYILGPIVGNLVIFLISGFNLNLLYNFKFFGFHWNFFIELLI